MRFRFVAALVCALTAARAQSVKEYRDFAMGCDGNVERGKMLFEDEARTGCAKCHSIDGSASKAGPDLFAVGEKFSRRDLIQAILEPSAAIAVGYGTTVIETKAGEEYSGIVKKTTDAGIDLAVADGQVIRVAATAIAQQRGTAISLMPEGLQNGLKREEFADLVEYLTTLRQPENDLTANRGLPLEIPKLAKPIEVRPFFGEEMRFPHAFVHKPGDVRSGLIWFGQAPGMNDRFFVAHQTGKIWLLEKRADGDRKTLFADLAGELFNERGPNGLLGIAFHPKFAKNRRYFVKHQVLEDGKIATVLAERRAAADGLADSGKSSRRLLKMVSSTQDHSGGCIGFGPDGYLYLAMGDTGPQQDPEGHGQDMRTLLGKILRIDVEGEPYSVPKDNPFVGRAEALPEIWALGFREPWRFSFDSVTGDLWVGDVGQDRVEEVAIVRRGENHGWNVYEGFEPFSNKYRKDTASYTPPIFAYRRKYGNSVTGGFVYRGKKESPFYGVYVCGDYTSKRIFGLTQENRVLKKARQIGESPQFIASFGTDAAGEIYVVGYEGMIYKLDLGNAVFEE
jgi:putative heme-binding domain-containing protein